MLRDTIKDKDYFDNVITKTQKLIIGNIDRYENNLLKPERVHSVINFTIGMLKSNITAKYSRGDDMFSDDIYDDYKKMITLMYDNWEENSGKFIVPKGKQITVLDQYTFSSYVGMLETISLGILLNAPNDDMKLLADLIDRDNVKDFLLEYLLRHSLKDRPEIDSESYQEYFHINERFFRLKAIISIDEKVIAQQEMKLFLEKDWEKAFYDTPVFQAHKSPHDTYVGYWCFPATAIVKIKGLDDSSFRDNQFYPKDLV